MTKVPSVLMPLVIITLQILSQANLCSAKLITCSPNITYLQSSCNATIYPRLCYRSLSVFACKIKANPKVLAHVALNVSLAATKETSSMIKRMCKTRGLKPIESAVLSDCEELMKDSLEELEDSMAEMDELRSSDFALQISNIQTWVSAALTNYETCKDGFDGHENINKDVKITLLRHVVKVSHRVSIALALVNLYASIG